MRPKATDLLNRLFRDNEDIVIVSASLVNWVSPFFTHIQRDSKSNFHVLGTIPEVKDGVITGRFLTYNCYGAEKVHCIRRLYPDRENYHLLLSATVTATSRCLPSQTKATIAYSDARQTRTTQPIILSPHDS